MATVNFKKVGSLVKVEATGHPDTYMNSSEKINIRYYESGAYAGKVGLTAGPDIYVVLDAITDIQVDGVAVTDQSDFDTQIATVFPEAGGTASPTLTEESLVITGLTTIDLSTVSDADVVNLTSTNATETIDSVTGIAAGKVVRLQPESGLTVTFTGTVVASAGAGDIVLPTSNFVANGTNRDYLSVTKDGSFVKQVDANNFI